MRNLTILLLTILAPGAAEGGELSRAASAVEYRFVKCARPAEPDMSIDPKLAGRRLMEARNARVRAYNVYIDGVNEYVECLAAEARADLEAYYGAVTAALDAEQQAISARADALRPGRGGAPARQEE